jgi:glycosyltransferase involved in cell wall biosynthesis
MKLQGLLRFIEKAVVLARSHDVLWVCSDSFYGIIGCLVGIYCHKPVVFDLYDNFEYFLAARLPVVKQFYHWALKRCDAVTCISGPLARLVESRGRTGTTVVVPNAVRDDLFYPMDRQECRSRLRLPGENLLIGTAGALDRARGIPTLFEGFRLLRQKHPEAMLVLAGPRASRLGIPEHPSIHYLGVIDFRDVPVLINALDVAVVCNLGNAFGRYCHPQKAVEIMACNVPLVSARVGSLEELFSRHPEWLYSPEDPEHLAAVLNNRIADRSTGYGDILNWPQAAAAVEEVLQTVVFRAHPLSQTL